MTERKIALSIEEAADIRGLLGLGDRQLVLLGERNLDVAGQGQVANPAAHLHLHASHRECRLESGGDVLLHALVSRACEQLEVSVPNG